MRQVTAALLCTLYICLHPSLFLGDWRLYGVDGGGGLGPPYYGAWLEEGRSNAMQLCPVSSLVFLKTRQAHNRSLWSPCRKWCPSCFWMAP